MDTTCRNGGRSVSPDPLICCMHYTRMRLFLLVFLVASAGTSSVCDAFSVATPTRTSSAAAVPAAADVLSIEPTSTSTPTLVKESATISTQRPELDQWRDYDHLRTSGLKDRYIRPFFSTRPYLIVGRLIQVAQTLQKAKAEWDDAEPFSDRGIKLCEKISSLGPVAVKIGQTLSQRPDLIGKEAADSFKTLQTANTPFADELAWAVIKESLQWKGPIAPGVGVDADDDPDGPTLFASITPNPVASASLGTVFRATTHEGIDVAVKVQRPDAMSILAKDAMCFRVLLATRDFIRTITNSMTDDEKVRKKQDIGTVISRVARDILREIDYEEEADNNRRFQESLSFLGFVTTPTLVPKYSSKRVLTTEWVKCKHLDQLSLDEGLAMTRMAVEAVTASLVLTGFVHADPHEGNLMLADDGKIVFLDFGLMSAVDSFIMEAFARGIQGTLAEDWLQVTKAFKDSGFITDPISFRATPNDKWHAFGIDENTGEDLGLAQLTKELGDAMKAAEGGTSRFGAIATVLNRDLSPRWLMFTPPYVLLLIRTFLTLEGIAAKVDPDFNIYETAMPWAMRRALSPMTEDGIEAFRSTLLTEDNRIQWNRLMELLRENDAKEGDNRELTEDPELVDIDQESSKKNSKKSKQHSVGDALAEVLGSTEGKTLRRVIRDLDSEDLIARLASKDAKPMRQAAARASGGALSLPSVKVWKRKHTDQQMSVANIRPESEESTAIHKRQARFRRKVFWLLLRSHLHRQAERGWRGALTMFSLIGLSCRIGVGAVAHSIGNLFHRKKSATG